MIRGHVPVSSIIHEKKRSANCGGADSTIAAIPDILLDIFRAGANMF